MHPKTACLRLLLVSLLAPLAQSQLAVNRTVDDSYFYDTTRPDGIQYSPQWYLEYGDGNRLSSTLHTSTTAYSNLVYFFQGDAIYYYADRDAPHGLANIYLDGDTKGVAVASNASSLIYQQLIWSKTGLGPGDHQLVISHGGTDGQYIGIDYLIVESDHGFIPSSAGPAASTVPLDALIVDDNDPQLIYSTGWDPVIPSQEFASYFKNTMHRTNRPGASVALKFNGTAAWYFTDMNPSHGKVNITIDGRTSWIVSGYSNVTLQQSMVWNVTNLAYGEHTLVVTHQDQEGTWATLDFFRYLSQPSPTHSKPPIGAIIGASIGGLAVIIIGLVVYIYVRRRRSTESDTKESTPHPNESRMPPLLNTPSSVQPAWGYVGDRFSSTDNVSVPASRREKVGAMNNRSNSTPNISTSYLDYQRVDTHRADDTPPAYA